MKKQKISAKQRGGCRPRCVTQIKIENHGTINIYTCAPSEELKCDAKGYPPVADSFEGCVPLAPGHKPKQNLPRKIDRILANNHVPSTLAAAIYQMSRRFIAGKSPENKLESQAFRVFQQLSPELRDILACSTQIIESLPTDQLNQLFVADFLGDIDQSVDPDRLSNSLASEITTWARLMGFETTDCVESEQPGYPRPTPGIEPGEYFFNPVICKVQGLRTNAYLPQLSIGDYLPDELQRECVPDIHDDEVRFNCTVQKTNCPGNSVEDNCLKVPEVRPGECVLLEGFNFFNIDGQVHLIAKQPGTTQRVLEAFVCGDRATPTIEVVNGEKQLISDCRVRDRLQFIIPDDLPPGIYEMVVEMPNNTGEVLSVPVFHSVDPQFLWVLPPEDAEFQISLDQIYAEEETSPSSGSDEVSLRIITAPIESDLRLGPLETHSFRFNRMDTGSVRDVGRVLLQRGHLAGVSLTVIGHEVDDEEAYTRQIQDLSDAYIYVLTSTWNLLTDSVVGALGGVVAALGVSAVIVTAVGAVVALLVNLLIAGWAPADLILEDTIGLTHTDLVNRTGANFPAPPRKEYVTTGGIRVAVIPGEKGVEYRENRSYRSDEEDSRYVLRLRYSRLL